MVVAESWRKRGAVRCEIVDATVSLVSRLHADKGTSASCCKTHSPIAQINNNFVEHRCNRNFDHSRYGMKPSHRFFQQHPSVNDPLPNLCISGQLVVKGDIAEVKEKSIVFDDGLGEYHLDNQGHVYRGTMRSPSARHRVHVWLPVPQTAIARPHHQQLHRLVQVGVPNAHGASDNGHYWNDTGMCCGIGEMIVYANFCSPTVVCRH